MDVQTMKLAALEAALKAVDHCGRYEVVNPRGSSKLGCFCYQRTQFSFMLFTKCGADDWSCTLSSMTDQEASMWLRGAGLAETK